MEFPPQSDMLGLSIGDFLKGHEDGAFEEGLQHFQVILRLMLFLLLILNRFDNLVLLILVCIF